MGTPHSVLQKHLYRQKSGIDNPIGQIAPLDGLLTDFTGQQVKDISRVLSQKPEMFDFRSLLLGTLEAVARHRGRFADGSLPYARCFRGKRGHKWLASVVAPEVNHLGRGNLATYVARCLLDEPYYQTDRDAMVREVVNVLSIWQEEAHSLPGFDRWPTLGWDDFDHGITQAQAASFLRSKGLVGIKDEPRHVSHRSGGVRAKE